MTAYTIHQQVAVADGIQTDTAAYSLGMEFEVSAPLTLSAFWFYSAAGAGVLPDTCAIYNAATQTQIAGTLLSSPSWSGAAASGWVRAPASGTVLSPGTKYSVVIKSSGGSNWYVLHQHFWDTGTGSAGITNGPLSAPNNASSVNGQELYNAGSTIAFPLTAFNALTWWIDVEVSTGGPSVATTAFADVAQGVQVRRWLSASGGTTPYTWGITAGALPVGMTLASNGALAGAAAGTGTSTFTAQVTDASSLTGSASLSITSVAAPFTPSSPSTDGNGVITWPVTSVLNSNDAESVRVLNPTAPSGSYPHGFLITMPVSAGTDDTTFGDGLDTVRTLGLHNTYNLTVIEPSTGGRWLADNPSNVNLIQETYILQVVAWAKTNYSTSGLEKVYLIGFSRTGGTAEAMLFHRPDLYYGVASWDFPAMMTGADGTDATNGSPIGGNPAGSYGTQDNFAANYELSPANLAEWSAGQNFGTVNRIWIGGYSAFQPDVTAYDPVLTAAGILHTYALVAASEHNWAPTPGWVAPALAAIVSPVFPPAPPAVAYSMTRFP